MSTQETPGIVQQSPQNQMPAFLQDAISSLEKMKAYATLLIESDMLPKHFYKLNSDKSIMKDPKSGLSIGNVSAVIMTIQHGMEVGMSVSQAIQQIVPINGTTSIKGDGAVALIQSKGACTKWIETVTGSIENEDYSVTIEAQHKNGRSKTVTFTVADAKRLGLWVSTAALDKNAYLKHSAWYKVPARMCMYRAVGYISRDLFPEVMQGMPIFEEARDWDEDNTSFVTDDGMKVTGMGEKSKGDKLNDAAKSRLKDKDDKNAVSSLDLKAKEEPAIQEAQVIEEKPVVEEKKSAGPDPVATENVAMVTYTKVELDKMDLAKVKEVANKIVPFDYSSILFTDENKARRVVGFMRQLILSTQLGSAAVIEFGKKYFKKDGEPLDLTPFLRPAEDPKIEKSPAMEVQKETAPADQTSFEGWNIPEPGEEGRVFDDMVRISDLFEKTGKNPMAYVEHNKIEGFGDEEAFFRGAPTSFIIAALK